VAEPHPDVVDLKNPLVARMRELCLSYPDAVEVPAWGRPTFRTPTKIFVILGATMERPLSIIIKPDPTDEPALRQDPRFWNPPYWGPFGWLAIDIDRADTDWQELAELVDASYRLVALKRQVRALDEHPLVR
jgi:predicted DNA-binding protein (MmcQ/YjbR family)